MGVYSAGLVPLITAPCTTRRAKVARKVQMGTAQIHSERPVWSMCRRRSSARNRAETAGPIRRANRGRAAGPGTPPLTLLSLLMI